jgi:hypothetical protein
MRRETIMTEEPEEELMARLLGGARTFISVRNPPYKILGTSWVNGVHNIGFVAYQCDEHMPKDERKQWSAVCGYVPPILTFAPDDMGAQYIASWGGHLSASQAAAFFPYLNIDDFRKD